MNGKEQSELPEDDYDVNDHDDNKIYYKVNVTCDNEVEAEWDYNAWNLKITNLDSGKAVNGTKCKLSFNNTDANGLLGMSSTERDNIIKQGVQTRRNTYRGKDITNYYEDGTLYEQISSGKFDDIYVGDYFKGKSSKIWLIADLDNYWNQGDKPLLEHHATIISSDSLESAPMNLTDTTETGYVKSLMVEETLSAILTNVLIPDFETHIIEYQNLLTRKIESTRLNQWYLETGASSDFEWASRKLDLMSEVNVFGTTMASSSSIYDVGIDSRQYAIFQLRPELVAQSLEGKRYDYWLKAIATSKRFVYVAETGMSFFGNASAEVGVRPRFLID